MTWLNRCIAGLRHLFRKSRHEQEMDDELREYLEIAVEHKTAAGLTRDDAVRAVLVETGSVAAVKDRIRDVGWESTLETVWQDVRFACRLIRKSPGFSCAVIATLGLGIGGTTAIFSVVDALFLRAPDGVTDASSLRKVYVRRNAGTMQTPDGGPGFWDDYLTARGRAPAFAGIAAYLGPDLVGVGRGLDATQVRASVISDEFLALLGVRPALGRLFIAGVDSASNAAPVTVISHGLWRSRFGGSPDAIGRTLLVNGRVAEIVGVTQNGFTGIDADPVDVWLPSSMAVPVGLVDEGWQVNVLGVHFVGRLAAGASDATATAQATSVLGQAADVKPSLDPTPEVLTVSMVLAARPGGLTRAGDLSLWLALVAGLVLIIACANVANLLLARGIVRRRELAVRLSLGAGTWRVARQHLTESAVLALIGGAAGVFVAYWAMGIVMQFPLPPSAGRIDLRLLLFALSVAMVTGLLFGILPAIRAVQIDPVRALRDSRGGFGHHRTRRALVVVQISLSMALLVGAGLFVRSLRQVNAVHGGADIDRLLIAKVDLRESSYPAAEREAFYDLAVTRLARIAGVERAAIVHFEPFSGLGLGVGWRIAGRTEQMRSGAFLNLAGPGYFEAAGTRLLRGRTIASSDGRNAEPIAVVNETLARLMADDGNVVGLCVPILRQLRQGGCTRIVGVVETQRNWYLDSEQLPMIFKAWSQAPDIIPYGIPALVIRTAGDPSRSAAAVRSALQSLRSDLPYVRVESLAETLRAEILPFRLGATLFGIFGLLALVLTGIGLYGVLGYFVTERTLEIGVRRALGAPLRSVATLVMRQGSIPVATGLLLGLVTARAGARYLSSMLFGVEAGDVASFAAAGGVLVIVTLAAMALPAWRAARVDLMVALRQD